MCTSVHLCRRTRYWAWQRLQITWKASKCAHRVCCLRNARTRFWAESRWGCFGLQVPSGVILLCKSSPLSGIVFLFHSCSAITPLSIEIKWCQLMLTSTTIRVCTKNWRLWAGFRPTIWYWTHKQNVWKLHAVSWQLYASLSHDIGKTPCWVFWIFKNHSLGLACIWFCGCRLETTWLGLLSHWCSPDNHTLLSNSL